MEAKDTVMNDEQVDGLVSQEGCCGNCLLEAQAEISFKAGIKEVVDWINQQGKSYQDAEPETHYYGEVYWQIPLHDWEAQLKEWDIEKPKNGLSVY